MNPVTHLLVGWVVANSADLNRRERAAVTIAAVIPDIDSVGIVAEKLTSGSDRPLLWWSEYHHVLSHNLGFAMLVALVVYLISERKWIATSLAFLNFHLHLLGDIVGARGPEGYQWPIPYLLPFSNVWDIMWQGQWAINAWPNFVVTGVALAITFFLAWKRGYSPLEMISSSMDKAFVRTLRARFGNPALGLTIDD
ncbi:MAG: metal-dependent hydrolase [Deltaproteobacteria bacterium]|nr:metal-dependent hydrolase [Deltaproteobacteria bacterium]